MFVAVMLLDTAGAAGVHSECHKTPSVASFVHVVDHNNISNLRKSKEQMIDLKTVHRSHDEKIHKILPMHCEADRTFLYLDYTNRRRACYFVTLLL